MKKYDTYEISSIFNSIQKDYESKEQMLKVVYSALKHMDETGETVDIKGLIADIKKVLK